jgi:hypothetical protein
MRAVSCGDRPGRGLDLREPAPGRTGERRLPPRDRLTRVSAGDPGFTPAVGEVVQLHSTTGACWGQTYSAPATRNDTGRFKDKL